MEISSPPRETAVERPHRCPEANCDKSFEKTYRLKEHIQRKHTKPMVCGFHRCPYRGGSKWSMTRHRKTHSRYTSARGPRSHAAAPSISTNETATQPPLYDSQPVAELSLLSVNSASSSKSPQELHQFREIEPQTQQLSTAPAVYTIYSQPHWLVEPTAGYIADTLVVASDVPCLGHMFLDFPDACCFCLDCLAGRGCAPSYWLSGIDASIEFRGFEEEGW